MQGYFFNMLQKLSVHMMLHVKREILLVIIQRILKSMHYWANMFNL